MKRLLSVLFVCCLFGLTPVSGKERVCVVLLSDGTYYPNFKRTFGELRNQGKYKGDVCLICIGDLTHEMVRRDFSRHELKLISFPEIPVAPEEFKHALMERKIKGHLQKFNIFRPYFKMWDTILYLDCGMYIHKDIAPLLALWEKDTLLAHSDAFPTYEWSIGHQFRGKDTEVYLQLEKEFDLTRDYFQTTMMLFDTSIITRETVSDLIELKERFPIGSSDQSYVSLYFTQIRPYWKQVKINHGNTYFYDFHTRFPGEYIMHKYPLGPDPCRYCEKGRVK